MIGLHSVPTANGTTGLGVSDVAEPQLAAAVLVALKLGDGRVGRFSGIETDDTSATRAATRLVLDLRLFDISNGTKEFNQVLVASRPRKLQKMSDGSTRPII